MARVVLENLSKTFKGTRGERTCAVNDLSLSVENGELLAVVGPSGCGKTTTLRLIAGLEKSDAGTISIDGRVINELPPKDRDVAMVFQNHALYPHMTAFENMAFGLKLRKLPRAEIELRVGQAAELLGLTDCLHRPPNALSGGQRQRVALGRAIVRQPKLFLFDEPLSNLDAPLRAQLRRQIARLHQRLGATMIYVTHDQAEAPALGQRVAVMKDGAIQQTADPLTIYLRPATLFVASFMGSPPMNLFRGKLVQKGDGLIFWAEGPGDFMLPIAREMAPQINGCAGKPVVLGVRAQDIVESLDPGAGVGATVEFVERIGGETHLHMTVDGHSFVVCAGTEHRFSPGQKASLTFDMRKAHFFDPVTEQRLA